MPYLIRACLLLLAAPASAATFTVDYWAQDLGDMVPGDGLCEWSTMVPVGQRCTLRAAIMEANALSGEHVIVVPGGAHIVLQREGRGEDAGSLGDLDITRSMMIGSNAGGDSRPIIDANGIDRVFDIHSGAIDVVLSRLRITGGVADSAGSSVGGGIRSSASGLLLISETEISGNTANAGSGLRTYGNTRIVESSLRGNVASNLGFTNTEGAAILASQPGTVLRIEASSVSSNLALAPSPSTRSAIEVHGIEQLRIENSTVSGNLPNGIYLQNADSLFFNHLSLVGNSVSGSGLIVFRFSGGFSSTISNSILAGYGSNCQFTGAGAVYSYSHNHTLSQDNSCWLSGFGTGNLSGVDPMLRPLSLDSWTGTRVHMPRPGSPAIDRADPLLLPFGFCLLRDQVGNFRPLDGDNVAGARCDMGAVEYHDRLFADGFQGIIG